MLDLNEMIPLSWSELLHDCRDTIHGISKKLSSLADAGRAILPAEHLIFSALQVRPEDVRVVVVGQDPYPDPRCAMGRAFAVPHGFSPLPGSLKNIFKERLADVGGTQPSSSLDEWQAQGVLLLNRILTVSAGQSGSHATIGWKSVTATIVDRAVEVGAVGVLWGKSAQELASRFRHGAVTGVHPSPLSAHRGFFGSRPFSSVNQLLDVPIRW